MIHCNIKPDPYNWMDLDTLTQRLSKAYEPMYINEVLFEVSNLNGIYNMKICTL